LARDAGVKIPCCFEARLKAILFCHKNFYPHSRWQIYDGPVALARLLKASGYKTALVGKWHLDFFGTLTHIPNKSEVTQCRFREGSDFDGAMTFIGESGDQWFCCAVATISPDAPLCCP
jgi:arylsulfatase A-like enzyme